MRDRDLAGRRGFIAEGEVVLRVLASSRAHRAAAILIAAKRTQALAPVLARFGDQVPVYAAGQAVMDQIAGFHIHRGILAFGERGPDVGADALLASMADARRIICLFGVANHDNIGGVFRNAAAFGVAAVLLDDRCCDPLYRKAIRVSVGAALTVPFARFQADEDPLALLVRHGFQILALSPAGESTLARLDPPVRAAVLLGAEGPGLPDPILARARSVAIPMADGFDSLNLATASGIVLNHLAHHGEVAS